MKFPFFFFTLIFPLFVAAEEVYLPELLNLFEADVVMDASFKSQNTDFFWVTVNEVMKGDRFGLKKGDTIRLKREDNGCGFEVDFSTFQRARFYIVKEAYSWRLNYHSVQSIKEVDEFGELRCNDKTGAWSDFGEAAQDLKTMNAAIREFLSTYSFNRNSKQYEVKVDAQELEKRKQRNIMVEAFERNGRLTLGDEAIYMNEVPYPEADKGLKQLEQEEVIWCSLASSEPIPPFDQEQMKEFLLENENPLAEEGVMGRVFVEFLIDETGGVSRVRVVRGIHSLIDKTVLKKVAGMPTWTPARNDRNQACKCKMVLPFRVDV